METIYYWSDGVLLAERTGEDYTQYLYDASGIIGMIHNGVYYYFAKNIFGDIFRVYHISGANVANFRYDSYGNIISQTGAMADKVHFRYRGYYYDTETGFYYLQTRYYDPSICRFISADQPELASTLSSVPGQLNMYAYCNNNPIMYTDETGEGILTAILLGALIGAVISGGFAVADEVATNGWDAENWDWKQIGLSTLGGGIAGGVSAIPLGGWLGALGFGGAGAVIGGVITGSVNNAETFFTALAIGAVANLIGYGINAGIAKYKAGTIYNLGNKAKSLAVQKLQAYPMNMGAVALKGSYRNAFKNVTQKEIQKLLLNANFWLRNSIFSSITSSSLSGWY